MESQSHKMKVLLLISIMACCWGPSFMFVKIAVAEIPPLTLVSLRLIAGSLIIYLFLRLQGHRVWPYRSHIKHFFVMGIFASSLPFFLIASAELFVSSSLTAIINGSTPIFTVCLAHMVLPCEKMTTPKITGVVLGFLGIFTIFAPQLMDFDFKRETGAFLVVLSAVSYAIGMVYSKKSLIGVPPLIAACAQLLCGAILITPFALAIDSPFILPTPSTQALASIAYISLIGTALAFPIYFSIVKIAGASALSTATLLFPIFGIILGVTVLDERIYWNTFLGAFFIFSGLLISNRFVGFPVSTLPFTNAFKAFNKRCLSSLK